MKAKLYLTNPAFRVAHPAQAWGGRNDQVISINRVSVNYQVLTSNLSDVLDRLIDGGAIAHGFPQWLSLMEALNNFINDVELQYPPTTLNRSGYEADSDSMSDNTYMPTFKRHKPN